MNHLEPLLNAFNNTLTFHFQYHIIYGCKCTVVEKKSKNPYLFQYKLSYRNETGTNHHGLVST